MRMTSYLLALASIVLPASWAAAASPSRPNILFIFTDDHARHAISAYGSKINQTPQLDRLAREGMLFRNCFCTNSICGPSRAVIQTGKHNHINGMIHNGVRFDGAQQTFPKLLQKGGYTTALVGKWHLQSDPTGFDYWEILPGQGRYYNPIFETATRKKTYPGYATDITTDLALEWLSNGRDKDKPFLLMCQHKAPHRAWDPAPRHLSLYDDVTIPEPDTLFDDYAGRVSVAKRTTMTIAKHMNKRDLKLTRVAEQNDEQRKLWDAAYGPKNEAFRTANLTGDALVRWKYQRYIKDYLRCVAAVDENIGRMLDYLDKNGLADNTVVMYSSDQGFYLGDHGWFDKRWMYEESLSMPLIVRWPGATRPGTTNTDLVQNLDFAETFLDLAGVPIPDDMQGRSFVPLLKGETPPDWRRSIYYHYYEFPGWHDVRRHYGVRTDRHKLIHYYDINEWELFDLKSDPDEMHSVYDDPAYAETVKELKAELTRLRKQYKVDTFKEPPPPPDPRKVQLEPVLHFDMTGADETTIRDTSGKNHHGQREHVAIVDGRRGKALRFDGRGVVQIPHFPASLDPTYRPLTVGAWCKPDAADGVLVAHGSTMFGYSLYLKNGYPCFDVFAGANPFQLVGPEKLPLEQWTHVAATIDADARLALWVNGQPVARLDDGFHVNDRPSDPFSVGADVGQPAGEYAAPLHFRGLIEDVRLYWGVLDDAAMRQWAAP
ncbi:MAG: sulfatase-like hydrolase/transferase [Phycisphaerae bacterium]|nr:sulfatase-like hydrolase/transferase [Phycisphaerae bacterium]